MQQVLNMMLALHAVDVFTRQVQKQVLVKQLLKPRFVNHCYKESCLAPRIAESPAPVLDGTF